jgi:hypothetical protein
VPQEVWDRALALVQEASMLLHEHNHPPRTEGTIPISATSWVFMMQADPQ